MSCNCLPLMFFRNTYKVPSFKMEYKSLEILSEVVKIPETSEDYEESGIKM